MRLNMSAILVKRGTFRNKPVINRSFTLVKGFHSLKLGNYVTVKNDGQYSVNSDEIKIKVDAISDIEYLNEEQHKEHNVSEIAFKPVATTESTVSTETDEQAMDRIATRFSILDEMTKAAIAGDVRALIVSGPPGVGKSYGVETQLEKYSLFDLMQSDRTKYEVVKGALTPIGLFTILYKFSDHRSVLVLDDCDSVWSDELSLNILKAALDSGKRRRIMWKSDSHMLRREGIPDSFDFNGSVIFITNLNFDSERNRRGKLADHIDALCSRSHYLDLTINDERDKMLRIKGVHRDAQKWDNDGLFIGYGFENGEPENIMDFMWNNRIRLRELSLRMALKLADLVKIAPDRWQSLAESTCMRG